MKETKIVQVTPDELAKIISDNIRRDLEKLTVKINSVDKAKDKPHLTRTEVSQFFNISMPCLHDWIKRGLLTPIKIGGKVFFLKDECYHLLLNRNVA